MSDEQKNPEQEINVGNVLNEAEVDRVAWEDFWEKRDIEQDLQEACKDLRDAYQTFE